MEWQYENGRILSTDDKNEVIAEATFTYKENGEIDINHTYVSPDLRGQGIAGKMMEAVAEYLRKNGKKATATCSYANLWLKNHRDTYPDVISKDIDGEAVACRIDGKH